MKTKLLAVLLFLMFVSPLSLSAQAFFKGIGVPVTVASTGQTEEIGLILAAMTNAPVIADTLVINLAPLQITNASPTDITVRANGLVVGTATIDTTNDWVEIPVQSSFSSSGSISIAGIRVAVAGTNISSFNAQLFWLNSENVFLSGASVPVISSAQNPLVARSITDPSVSVNGQTASTSWTIQLGEGFAGVFSDSSQYGQTGPTEIQITVTDFPIGEQLQFPVTVNANETAAAITIVGGGPITLTGNGSVTYSYSSAANSGSVAESFNITINLVPTSSAQPTFHVTLAPIGAAVPTATLPAANIPRYAESEILVLPSLIVKTLYWTGANPSLQNQIQVTNPDSRPSDLTIDAFDSNGNKISGAGVTNPVKLTLPASQSLMSTLSNLFGSAAGVSSMRIQSTSPNLIAAAFVSASGFNQAVPFVSVPFTSVIFPVVSDSAQLQLMNANPASITGTMTLFTADGDPVSTATVNLSAFASTKLTAQTVFGKAPESGYALAIFSDPVIAYESFGKGNLEAMQPPTAQPAVFVPFVAGGSAFKSSVKLINLSHDTITLNAQLFANNGSQLAVQEITMQPTAEIVESIQQIFSQSPDTAYVEFDLPQTGKGIFLSYPLIDGQAQIETSQGGSTVIPFWANQSSNSFILGQGVSPASFEGIAFLNPTASNVTVILQVVKLDGTVAASATVRLSARQLAAQLTDQLFNGTLPAQTVIRITSSAPIAATAITGSITLDQILALPVLR